MTATSTPPSSPTSVAEVRDRVREAVSQKRPLRVVAGGTWLDANRPVEANVTLVMREVSGIVEYEPGDLTLTARAGTTLDEIARATAAHGQWLTLDPYGDSSRATIGATIATAAYGPLAHHFGTPRDVALGVEFVSGIGDIVRGGGRVVKNVAGFDLTRLITGSWGSLGVISEVTVRLRAVPAVQATLAIDVTGAPDDTERARHELNRLPFVPLATALIDNRLSATLSAGGKQAMLVRLGGNEDAVRAQRDQLRALGEARELESGVWRRLCSLEPERAAVLRLSRLPSDFAATWREATRIVEQWSGAYCNGDPGRGVVRVVLPLDEGRTENTLQAVLAKSGTATRVYERLPAALWTALAPGAMRGRLARDIKSTFDPQHVLNPGILGEVQ
ncbi:MAG TPA: FAD-binding protein [Gemmatimonadaceae bacterium]|nr:FAD-binding protein [Gemmatimonadaceae bacterium]